VLWLVPGLAFTKSKINSGELTDKYQRLSWPRWLTCSGLFVVIRQLQGLAQDTVWKFSDQRPTFYQFPLCYATNRNSQTRPTQHSS